MDQRASRRDLGRGRHARGPSWLSRTCFGRVSELELCAILELRLLLLQAAAGLQQGSLHSGIAHWWRRRHLQPGRERRAEKSHRGEQARFGGCRGNAVPWRRQRGHPPVLTGRGGERFRGCPPAGTAPSPWAPLGKLGGPCPSPRVNEGPPEVMTTLNLLHVLEEVQVQLEAIRSLDRIGSSLIRLLLCAVQEWSTKIR